MDKELSKVIETLNRASKALQEGLHQAKDLVWHQPPPEISLCEEGNIWLVDPVDGHHNAWFRLNGSNHWLEITIRLDSCPGFHANTIEISDQDLAEHINRYFWGGNWLARKMELNGVLLTPDHYVVGSGKEDDS